MPTCCCVPSCSNQRRTGSGRTFHKFPTRDPALMSLWLCKIGRDEWVPTKRSVLCSDHFAEEDFDRTGQTVRIRDGAFPTIFKKPQKKNAKKLKPTGKRHPRKILAKIDDEVISSMTEESETINATRKTDSPVKKSRRKILAKIDDEVISSMTEESETINTTGETGSVVKKKRPRKILAEVDDEVISLMTEESVKINTAGQTGSAVITHPRKILAKIEEFNSTSEETVKVWYCVEDSCVEDSCVEKSPSNGILSSSSLPNIDISQIPPALLKDPAYQSYLLYKASIAQSKMQNQQLIAQASPVNVLPSNEILSSSSLPNNDISQIPPALLKDPSYQSYLLYKASIAQSKVQNQQLIAQASPVEYSLDKQELYALRREHYILQGKYQQKCQNNESLRKRLKTAFQRIRRLNKTFSGLASAIIDLDNVKGDDKDDMDDIDDI